MALAETAADSIFSAAIERVAILHQEEVAKLKGEIAAFQKKVAELSSPPVGESAKAHVDLPRSADDLSDGRDDGIQSKGSMNMPSASGYSRRANFAPARTLTSVAKPAEVAKVASSARANRGFLMSSAPMAEIDEADVRNRIAHKIVSHPAFDVVIGILIVANAVKLGYAASLSATGEIHPVWLDVLEFCFLSLYVLELVLRVSSIGRAAFKCNWVKFDAVLVSCATVDTILLPIVHHFTQVTTDLLDKMLAVRLLRLARLAQLLRLVVEFRTLWLLVSGLMNSLLSLIYTFVVIGVILYMFAVASIMLVRPDPTLSDNFNNIVAQYFSSLPIAILTLTQGVTLDSFASIYVPLVIERPALAVYFVVFTLSVSIALMNLVTALTVEMAFAQAAADKEVKRAYDERMKGEIVEELKHKFALLDTDGSGQLGLAEFKGATPELLEYVQQVAGSDDIEHIFCTLDYDNTCFLSIEEFCDGLVKFNRGKSVEMTCIIKMCAQLLHELKSLRILCADRELAV